MKSNEQKTDAFTLVTNVVIDHLEKGMVPWKKPWADKGLPINLKTCKPYGGINLWLLNALDYPDNLFLTANQAKELGGHVRKDEKPVLAVYWKWPMPATQTELSPELAKKAVPKLGYYYLFNLAQCAGIPEHCVPVRAGRKKNYPIDVCKEVIASMPKPPEIRNQGDRAYYQPVYDLITVPSAEKFANSEYYYATLFKQLIFSTRHANRLNRKASTAETSEDVKLHTLEELTAEIGSCYLSSYCGIDTWNLENRLEYAQVWIEKFKSDSRIVVYATIQAQKAVEYILNANHAYTEEMKIEDRQFQTETYE